MIRAVLFDLGNTLITCRPWFRVELQALASETLLELARQGHLASTDDLLERADRFYEELHARNRTAPQELTATQAMTTISAELGLDLPPVAIATALETIYRACVPAAEPCEGAHETLTRLRAAGYRLGLLSNARYGPFVPWALEATALAPYLEIAAVSADIGWRKPSPQAFHLLLDQLGVPAHEAVYVGDYYPYDIVGAKAAGMRTAWLRVPHSPTGDDADAEIDSLPEVVGVLGWW